MSAIVIRISSFFECPARAVQGVILNHKMVKELHFVYPMFQDEETSMYDDWLKVDRPKLEQAGVKIHFDARLAIENFGPDIETVTEVPAECKLTLGAWQSIRDASKRASINQTHLGLSTKTDLSGRFSFMYGFLIVSCLIDWFWGRIFERNKLIQHYDVRTRFVLQKGKHRHLPDENRFIWRLWNPDVIPKVFAGETATIVPSSPDYTTRYFSQHRHYRFGGWLLPLFLCWVIASFTWPVALYSAVTQWTWMPSMYTFAIWAIEFVLCSLICGKYVETRANVLYYALFPFYFIMFPFVVVYSKLN